jgi:DNA-binding protein YbaB
VIDPEVQRLIERMSTQAEAMARRVTEVRGEGADDRNLVRATCGPGGRLLDLAFAPEVRRLQTHELREQILVAVQRATEAADESLREATGAISGLADGLGGQAMLQQAQQEVAQYRRIVDEQLERVAQLQAGLRR